MEQAKITVCKQHYIDWASAGGYEQFLKDYQAAPDYEQKRFVVDGLMMQTNREWLEARRGHITASTVNDFLAKGRKKGEEFGKMAQKAIRKYMAEKLGWEEQEATFSEKFHIKRGLVFERRAIELFATETGFNVKNDIGFVSREINGIKFGCSPDAYIVDDNGVIAAYVEIKSFELQGFLEAVEELASPKMQTQMQSTMMVTDTAKCYAVWYCPELDKIVYISYTRGLNFRRNIETRTPLAIEYMKKLEAALNYTNLTDKIMESDNE